MTHSPETMVDIKATFAPQETGPRHLFVCTSGYAVSLLDHSVSLCFNTGWILHHRARTIRFDLLFDPCNHHEKSYRVCLMYMMQVKTQ